MAKKIQEKSLEEWTIELPLLKKIIAYCPVVWLNDKQILNIDDIEQVSAADMVKAKERWDRFAPYLMNRYSGLEKTQGEMVSPLLDIENFKKKEMHDCINNGEKMFLKGDHLLPIAGSIKARGGVYEVLKYAEQVAFENNLLSEEINYEQFVSEKFSSCFQNYTIGVGSTGNLALSIGITASDLGFQVYVYMSKDAREWKKELLRKHGVIVKEFTGDFSEAIDAGREEIKNKQNSHFIDDENSKDLFLGYSVAALELKEQLKKHDITINENHPLLVYLPCGVGGSPGGLTYGLKRVFGAHVHCFYAEPTHSPSVLIGLMTGLKEKVTVHDFGLDNKTSADGLAVGRPSSFASPISEKLVSGIYTEEDSTFKQMGLTLWRLEKEFVEPSAAAGLSGPRVIKNSGYRKEKGLTHQKATHLVWATGGSSVPKEEREELYK